jgi:hypothetical protein
MPEGPPGPGPAPRGGHAAAAPGPAPPVGRSLDEAGLADLVARVEQAAAARARRYPADPGGRPVHTVYVAADRFAAGTATAYGAEALRLLDAHAPDGATLAAAVGLDDPALAAAVREQVAAKLAREPVEDLRIDFEDGYGVLEVDPRGGPGRGPGRRRGRRGDGGRHPAAVRRPAGQVVRRRAAAARHPLPSRYAAVYAWRLDGFDQAAARVRAFHTGAPGPGGVLDEPATVKALVAQVRRAVHCGAVLESEALGRTGLDRATLLGG